MPELNTPSTKEIGIDAPIDAKGLLFTDVANFLSYWAAVGVLAKPCQLILRPARRQTVHLSVPIPPVLVYAQQECKQPLALNLFCPPS